jgi:hypothetical protein
MTDERGLKQKFFNDNKKQKSLHFRTRSLRFLAALHTEKRKKPHVYIERERKKKDAYRLRIFLLGWSFLLFCRC